MPLSSKELTNAMKLAALVFDQEKKDEISAWIQQVLDWFQELDRLDDMLEGLPAHISSPEIPPASPPPRITISQKDALQNASSVQEGYIKSNRIL